MPQPPEQQTILAKRRLRDEMKRRLSSTPPSSEAGQRMASHLTASPVWQAHRALAGFMPFGGEPDVLPLLQLWLQCRKALLLPVFDRESRAYALAQVFALDSGWLATQHFGIREPLPHLPRLKPPFADDFPDVWLVPGLAFSPQGERLGRGCGYYDRLLHQSRAVRIGVAYDCQIVESLPIAPHDIPMDYLLTESAFHSCRQVA
ncbi:MAG: 5-formyltetrahydrofolate cyclo-ligase [Victivallales bacterium]|nr:5-formyltetrahydrofolate cyclo-ligase [Victivallales bacterium]